MITSPTVSIVIPARNAVATLTETIASLSAQTHVRWEAIVVDDGSQDGTVDLARAIARSETRLQVVSQPAAGVCAARNNGTRRTAGEWLLYLDADDWIAPHHLERLLEAGRASDVDVVYCGWARVAPDGRSQPTPTETDADLFEVLAQRCAFAIHACIVRRSDGRAKVAGTGVTTSVSGTNLICCFWPPRSTVSEPLS